MNLFQLAQQAWPYALVAAPGLLAAWRSWQTSSEARRRDEKDLIRIAQDAAGAVIEDLRDEIARLHAELDQLRKEHSEMIASKDAEITLLRGELRQAEARIAAYERMMERAGIAPPRQGDPFWELQDGRIEPRPREGPP